MTAMKRIAFVLLLVAALASPAMAGQVQVGPGNGQAGDYGIYQTGSGGEFTINALGNYNTLSYFAGAKDINAVVGSFQTFCIEDNEYISPYPTVYNASLSNVAVLGGIGGGSPDPISYGTAYLSSTFAAGGFAGAETYNYANTPAGGRNTSANLLQQAFWWLEDEGPVYDASNPYMAKVVSVFLNPKADAPYGYSNVYAMNLWTLDGGYAQDVLYTGVPDGGATLMLLGGALVGLGGLRR